MIGRIEACDTRLPAELDGPPKVEDAGAAAGATAHSERDRHHRRVDERRLVEAAVAGDHHAFRMLVERESTSVFRTCYRILGRIHDAEDAAQESFVIAYRALSTYRGEGSVTAWLARIATRHALRRFGQRRDAAWLDPASPGGLDLPGTDDPALHAVTVERQRTIRDAVAALPEPYREVVVLHYFSELTLAEVAATTGRPIGTVKTHLHRGLERLRERMMAGAPARAAREA